MHPTSTADFASAARELTRVARRRGLVGPSFRCPPRLVGVDRSIRRRSDGATVAVRLRGRPWPAVLADMIEGVVAANRLTAPQADRLRAELWTALGVESGVEMAGAQRPGRPGSDDRADDQGISARVA
jgi:hypothetical protein